MVFIFLDTNVLQYLRSFGEYIYDNYLSEKNAREIVRKWGARTLEEVRALHDIVFVARRGSLPIAISSKSLDEFEKTPSHSKRRGLMTLGMEMLGWWEMNRKYILFLDKSEKKKAARLAHTGKLRFLPDETDRLLVAEAVILGCDTFLTLDRKTILRFKKELSKLGLDATSPKEFVEKHEREMAGA